MISEGSEKPLACWRGKERHARDIIDCLTVIFRSGGCSWARCRMCSYRHERYESRSCEALYEHLRRQMGWVRQQFASDTFRMVKIFTSGSFFDPAEVPLAFREEVARTFRGKIIITETRPEYVEHDAIRDFVDGIDDGSNRIPLYCAIGLETTNDRIREKCINKGFTYADFLKAASVAHAAGAGVKAYLLHKPLFLTEGEAVLDMKTSIAEVSAHSEIISMNPCTVQRKTELEQFWRQGAYRPPYLWSILAILHEAPVHVSCDPLGGGQKRGPHNCGKCDDDLVRGIRDYSLTADRDLIGALLDSGCPCKAEWNYVFAHERSYGMPLTR